MRLFKQLLYGTFYILILGGISWGIYSFEFKPAPSCFDNKQNGQETGVDCGGNCLACEIKNLKPLEVMPALLLSDDRFYSVLAEIKNPNSNFALKSFEYEINFYDAQNNLLKSTKNNSFIYAGESKNIIEAGIRITNGIPKKAELKISPNLNWIKSSELEAPAYELKDIASVLENGQVAVSGTITNPKSFFISKVSIGALASDNLGAKIGASKTELQNVGPFRVESFKIFVPVKKTSLPSVDLNVTKVFVEALK